MKFTLTSETVGFGSPKNTLEFEVDHIDDVLMYFRQFLKGAGYEISEYESIELVSPETVPNCDYYDDGMKCVSEQDYYTAVDASFPFTECEMDCRVDLSDYLRKEPYNANER